MEFLKSIASAVYGKQRDYLINEEITQKYNFTIKQEQEKPIKIEQLFLYPCRGIRGIEVDSVKLTKFGIKGDREWGIYDKETLKPITQAGEVKYMMMRQRIERNKETKKKYLVFYLLPEYQSVAETLPSKELKICINDIPKGDTIDNGLVKGISEGEEAEKWFTAFLETPAFLMRSLQGFTKGLVPNMKWQMPGDLSKSFLSKTALHIINQASIRDITEKVMQQYPNEEDRKMIKVDPYAFRPSILIDTGIAYEEDTVKESRIGNAFIRIVGYCSRCKATANNYDTIERNPSLEPYTTITKLRKHELGYLFGTYNQVDIIPSKEQYQELLPNYPEINDREFKEEYAIIKKGDYIYYRVFEKLIDMP